MVPQQKEQRDAGGQRGSQDAPPEAMPTGEFLQNIATQTCANIKRVVNEGCECHERERDANLCG